MDQDDVGESVSERLMWGTLILFVFVIELNDSVCV